MSLSTQSSKVFCDHPTSDEKVAIRAGRVSLLDGERVFSQNSFDLAAQSR